MDFKDIPNSFETSHNDIGYINIKPESKNSVEEADSFWDSVFEEQKPKETFPEELLIMEAFDRDESEISIRYEISDNVSEILKLFDDSIWDHMDSAEKEKMITSIIEGVADDLGITDVPKVVFYHGLPDDMGKYNQKDNTIHLNRAYFDDPIEMLNTAMHELRHSYQHQRAAKAETFEDAVFKYNFDNYISPIPLQEGKYLFYTDYYNQYVEVDARVFADKIVGAII